MNHTFILQKIIEVYEKYEVYSFPIDCARVIEDTGYQVVSYRFLDMKNPGIYDMCMSCSDDAYREPINKIVAFNQDMPAGRINFSLAHELGHIVLEHPCSNDYYEQESNFFASNFLAPRMAIHYSRCKNANDVAKKFNLSDEAAQYAFEDYRRWHRYIVTHGNKMSQIDRAMYAHFYNQKYKGFVWHIDECYICGKKVLNNYICGVCEARRQYDERMYNTFFPEYDESLIAEESILYRFTW